MDLVIGIGLKTALGAYAVILASALLTRLGWMPRRLALAGRVMGRSLASRRLIGGPVRLLQSHPLTGGAAVSAGLGALAALTFVALLYAIVIGSMAVLAFAVGNGIGEIDDDDEPIGDIDLLVTSSHPSMFDGPLGIMKNGIVRELNPLAMDDPWDDDY